MGALGYAGATSEAMADASGMYGPYRVTRVLDDATDATIVGTPDDGGDPVVVLLTGSSTHPAAAITVSSGHAVIVLDGAVRDTDTTPLLVHDGAQVTLYLAEGSVNRVDSSTASTLDAGLPQPGIHVGLGSSLTIEGPGQLIVRGGPGAPGIDLESDPTADSRHDTGSRAGVLTIEGGIVDAQGGDRADSGIGGTRTSVGDEGPGDVGIGSADTGPALADTGRPVVAIHSGSVRPVTAAGQIRVDGQPVLHHDGTTQIPVAVSTLVATASAAEGTLPTLPGVILTLDTPHGPYTARTDSTGAACLWLEPGVHAGVAVDPATGARASFQLTVDAPDDLDSFDPLATPVPILVTPPQPGVTLSVGDPTAKAYGSAILSVDIDHKAGDLAGARVDAVDWFRDSLVSARFTTDQIEDGFLLASPSDRGRGGAGMALDLVEDGDDQTRYEMVVDRDATYWARVSYTTADGTPGVLLQRLDVDTVYTPVTVNVRGVSIPSHPHATGAGEPDSPDAYTELAPGHPLGIPMDLGGGILPSPALGFDAVAYQRDPDRSSPRWEMTVPGAHVAPNDRDAQAATITLDARTYDIVDATPESTPTRLFYTVTYRETAPMTTLTLATRVAGGFADRTQAFSYTVLLTQADGSPLTTDVECHTQDGDEAPCGLGSVLESVGVVTLSHGGSLTFSHVPSDARVEVIQTPVPGYDTSYVRSDDPTRTPVTGVDTLDAPMADDVVIEFTNTRVLVPVTGVDTPDTAPGFLLPALFLAMGASLVGAARIAHRRGGGRS